MHTIQMASSRVENLYKERRLAQYKSNLFLIFILKHNENNNSMEQRALKNVNNHLNTHIYSYLETSGVQSHNLYLNVAHFFQHQS